MGTGDDWNTISGKLSGEFFCIMPDLPGHGESTEINDSSALWSFEGVITGINDILVSMDISKIILVGYSMGGRIALGYVNKYPDLITKLIIESASPGIENEDERKARWINDQKIADRLNKGSFNDFLKFWYDQELFKGIKDHQNFNTMLDVRKRNNPKLLAKALLVYNPAKQASYWNRLDKIHLPTLLIGGKQDKKYSEILSRMADVNSSFNLRQVADCGHNVHFEMPHQFAEHLREFLTL
jgi:2-succinyl-6-hydroxy-2,4-cyclohexadiene-1-carboxylate synthase